MAKPLIILIATKVIPTNYISYKDSAARVVFQEGIYYRYIFKEYSEEYEHLMKSGLYEELISKGLLIKHEETELSISESTSNTQIYKRIRPEQIEFQSYPFEWSYLQWRRAIFSYLSINKIALKYGMLLKDATPYNFYLSAGKAIMLDTSSFEFFKNGDKWKAYRQFCAEFLGPVALMHFNGQRWSRLTRSHLRGLPLNFISKQLPLRSWLSAVSFLHIHFHSKYANAEGKTNETKSLKNDKGFTLEKLKSLFAMIQSGIKGWSQPYSYEKHWSEYYENDIEVDTYLAHKEQIIRRWLEEIKFRSVLDLGANTGRFSFVAADYAEQVIAAEFDDTCVDIIEKEILRRKASNINALVVDLADATPNLGVLDKEFLSIYTRAKSDLVMALAIVHHLSICDQLSFNQIAEMLAKFSAKYAIVEFIPKPDSKVQLLMHGKTNNFNEYTEDKFIEVLSKEFIIRESFSLKNSERKLFLIEKKLNDTI